jgi:hypothetical protein
VSAKSKQFGIKYSQPWIILNNKGSRFNGSRDAYRLGSYKAKKLEGFELLSLPASQPRAYLRL